jgi:alkylation response protein AidB-like acyl-CoA dehydrogenase
MFFNQRRHFFREYTGSCMAAMPEAVETAPLPLTALSEDEKFFQSTVRKFAREQIRPYVREMDEAGVFRKDIIKQFFEMGLMGIEIPEEYGGQGGRAAASFRRFSPWKSFRPSILRPA